MHELSKAMKIMIRHDNGIQMWCDELIKHFKVGSSKALDKLYAVKYTLDDARNLREPIDHVQVIIQYGKSAYLCLERPGSATTARCKDLKKWYNSCRIHSNVVL